MGHFSVDCSRCCWLLCARMRLGEGVHYVFLISHVAPCLPTSPPCLVTEVQNWFRVLIYLWYLDESACMVGVEDGGGGGWWWWMWSKIAWGWEGNLGNLQLFSVQIFHSSFLSAPDITSVTCCILGLQVEAFSWFQIKPTSFFKILPAGSSLPSHPYPEEAHRCWPNPFC